MNIGVGEPAIERAREGLVAEARTSKAVEQLRGQHQTMTGIGCSPSPLAVDVDMLIVW